MSDDEKSAAGEKDAPLRSARQWVVVRGTSMDLRVGTGILSEFPRVLRSAAGRPHACALVHEGDVSDDVVRVLHDNLCDQGFRVSTLSLGAVGCDLAEVERLNVMLRDARITSDDIVLAVGGLKTLSVASFVCSSWLGGTQLAEVPTDLASAVVAATTPRALDSAGLERVVSQDAAARYTMIDLDLVGTDPKSDTALLAFALMVQTAMCDSDRAFGKLWDAADDLAAGDEAALTAQLQDTLKSRGKVSSATSAALRQSLEFGTTFADALLSLAPGEVSRATALADGMRFAARLGVAQETMSVDDMLAVDELLERLGVPTARVTVDAGELATRIRDARFQRTNRFMLAVPRALGRVRLAVMTDDLLAEHTAAWCASRP